VVAGNGATLAHGSADGGSPVLGSPVALVQQARRGKGQNREGTTPNSPRQSVLSGKWRFGLVAMAFPIASSRLVWVLLRGPPMAMESETGSLFSSGAHRLKKPA
jgi:hypothetical protein